MASEIRTKTERPIAVFDLECYRNYAFFGFMTPDGNKVGYERSDRADFDPMRIRKILRKYTVVGFNSRDYDMMVLLYALNGATNEQLKKLSDWIIQKRKKPWDCEREFGIVVPNYVDHVDLFDTNPSVGNGSDDDDEVDNTFASGSASLKTLGGRLHVKRLQDLPVEPDALLTHEQMDIVGDYCLNSDCPATLALYHHCKQALELRESIGEIYGMDARSLSDAQTGERMIKIGVERLIKKKIEKSEFRGGYSFRYEVPDFIEFQTPLLQNVLKVIRETDIQVLDTGSVPFPDAFKKFKIEIGQSSYKLGIGGLHSQEKCRAELSDDEWQLVDFDVGSQYPSIIIKLGLYPKAVGPKFQPVYSGIKEERMADKRRSQDARDAGDREKELFFKVRSDGRKVGLNGPYGKLGSKYSVLFAPHLMIATTLTGQLTLLMLIERAELNGIRIISANTDGVVMKVPRSMYQGMKKDRPAGGFLKELVEWWENMTSFVLEGAEYQAIYNRDVNFYLAIKPDGKGKRKGYIANHWHPDSPEYSPSFEQMKKNPNMTVIGDALLAFLTKGTPIEEFIRGYKDVRGFVRVIKAKGGGDWNGEYLGKTVRFYWSKSGGAPIMRGKPHAKTGNRNKVSKSDGCRPLMILPDDYAVPPDLDYSRYIAEAYEVLGNMGWQPEVTHFERFLNLALKVN
ncbi:DNA polymerase protein [Rhizobium phage RHph_X2_30]|nr:DNA polymerase protein [Rhizobium phage RHph_X2_30]